MSKVYRDPFSNGTEFEDWTEHNCERCIKASRFKRETIAGEEYTNCNCAIQRDIECVIVLFALLKLNDMKKKLEWQDVYQLPIHRDDFCFRYAYTNNDVMALTFLTDNEDFINKFIDVVNGNVESHAKKEWHNEGCEI